MPQRIAIIGGGISGLSAAWMLARYHNVTLFEAAPRLGGHARTVVAGRNNDVAVDTGFIVFNYANYPHLTRMFDQLDVPVERSDMSFGATINNGEMEYGLKDLNALFGQKRNLLRPQFARMVRDIFRFNAQAEAHAISDSVTVGDLVRELGLGPWFYDYYLMPICGAIWSTPPTEIADFPAKSLIRFFRNHALLSATGQHQWWTVSGGSREYVTRLEQDIRLRGADLRCGSSVHSVKRDHKGVEIFSNHGLEHFDQVIFACHSDDALSLLEAPTVEETRWLGAVKYQDNKMVLHRDASQMPKRKSCWSSWVYKAETRKEQTAIGVTYWMNRLQNLPEDDLLLVTLNPSDDIPDNAIYDETVFRHPVFDRAAISAQKEIARLQGKNHTWFAGAWLRNGFHEDGFASSVRIARALTHQDRMHANIREVII